MTKFKEKNIIIYILIFTLCLSAVILSLGFVFGGRAQSGEEWNLRSYGNSVALYNGNEIVEVYSTISVEDLPEEDKKLLKNGIAFPTKEEAKLAIEDYDG